MNKITSIFSCLLFFIISQFPAEEIKAETIKIYENEFDVYVAHKGESLYAIAQKMNWDYDLFVQTNILSDAKISNRQFFFYPIQTNNTETKVDSLKKEIVLHHPTPNESLHDIAIQYNTSVERIFELNPILSDNNFHNTKSIRIEVNSNIDKIIFDTVDVKEAYAFKHYKIQKKDSWSSIAEVNNISVEELHNANPWIENLKKGEYVYIPLFKIVRKEIQQVSTDNRELTHSGLEEIYNSVHNTYTAIDSITPINMAIITNIAENKTRDAEFLKGFLMGIDYLKDNIHKINLSVYDLSIENSSIETILAKEELKEMDFIISTDDKDFPQELFEFGLDNDIEIINLFDLNNESFKTNPQVIQIYPPSSHFNRLIASYLVETFSDYTFIFIGNNPDNSEAIENIIKSDFDNDSITYIQKSSIDHISSLPYDNKNKYLFIPQITKKADIDKFINNLLNLKNEHSTLEFSVVGKPNWIALPDGFREYLHQINTFIPSRFYFDKSQPECKNFEADFMRHYGYLPVQTNPIFAAVGYDVARYFIESYFYNHNDMNNQMADYNALQTDFKLLRIDNWSGLYNRIAYLVHFTPYHTIEKITISN